MVSRRRLLIALAANSLAAPFAFAQQQGKVWRIGYLFQGPRPTSLESHQLGAFQQDMRELGYVEGKNLTIEWRFAEDKPERFPALAAELVQLKVDVIVASQPAGIRAAQTATTTIPIVMTGGADPVGSGFIKSLAHPGGNITGRSNMAEDVSAKQLEMLLSMVPRLPRVAVLMDPDNTTHAKILKNIQAAAPRIGVTILPVEARTPQEIERAFATVAQKKAGALIVLRGTLFVRLVRPIAELAAKYRLPTMHGIREYVEAGGLMSYGTNNFDQYRRAATYVDKIFKGAKPADLPVEQPTKFELFINGKAANALGLKIPQSLLIMADKVIE